MYLCVYIVYISLSIISFASIYLVIICVLIYLSDINKCVISFLLGATAMSAQFLTLKYIQGGSDGEYCCVCEWEWMNEKKTNWIHLEHCHLSSGYALQTATGNSIVVNVRVRQYAISWGWIRDKTKQSRWYRNNIKVIVSLLSLWVTKNKSPQCTVRRWHCICVGICWKSFCLSACRIPITN